MDSVTQILLGASCAAAVVPAPHRRFALALGAALGTLPDLDVLPLALVDDPIAKMTWHRSVSHSLLVLLPFGVLLWLAMRRWSTRVRERPRAWLVAILLALGTHPLLDAHTVYGTQLWWPLPVAPTMWSTLFIIDPLYTVPLLVGVVSAALLSKRVRLGRQVLLGGLILSTAYVGWSWIAKWQVESRLMPVLAADGLDDAPRFSVPTPFNTWAWRVVAMSDTGYTEYYATPFGGEPAHRVVPVVADRGLMQRVDEVSGPAARLAWFAHGFVATSREGDDIVVTDLRMGAHPDYIFRFRVAHGDAPMAVAPEQLPAPEVRWERVRAMWP
jgi:inner membrane protein